MSVSLPSPSSRLLRAAAAEQADLARHRERLVTRRDTLLDELRELDGALGAVDERLAVLGRLGALPPTDRVSGNGNEEIVELASRAAPPANDEQSGECLRGPAIREAAVRVVVAQPERIDALHYRRWYELLGEAGYSVAGKDPLAVFLTQVSRSPVVRKTTKPGVYEIDRQAPERIRQRLQRLQGELREIAVAPQAPVDLADVRSRRHELDLAISQQERALEEALRVLGRDTPGTAAAAAAADRG